MSPYFKKVQQLCESMEAEAQTPIFLPLQRSNYRLTNGFTQSPVLLLEIDFLSVLPPCTVKEKSKNL